MRISIDIPVEKIESSICRITGNNYIKLMDNNKSVEDVLIQINDSIIGNDLFYFSVENLFAGTCFFEKNETKLVVVHFNSRYSVENKKFYDAVNNFCSFIRLA